MEGVATTARRQGPKRGTLARSDGDALLAPKSIALIGATERTYFARNIFRNLWEHRYQGAIHLVNARRSTVFGEPAVPSLRHIPSPVDQAIVLAGQEHLAGILEDCSATGVRSVVILSSIDPADLSSGRLRADLDRAQRRHALQVLGPSSLGYINVSARVPATVTHLRRLPPPGPIAVLSQSGAFMIAALRLLEERSAGASFLVSLGNEADLDLEFYLERAIDDPRTRVVCLVLEGLRRPAAFVEQTARALAAGKTVIALKQGRSDRGRELALSHTGARAGSQAAFEAVCRRTGVVLVDDLDELIELAVLFSQLPTSTGSAARVGVVVASGGAGLMAADAAAEFGASLPALTPETTAELTAILPPYASISNPLDTTAQVRTDSDLFDRATSCFTSDGNIDLALFVFALGLPDETSPSHQASFEQVARLRGSSAKPLLTASAAHQQIPTWGKRFLRRTGVPYVRGVRRAFRGLQAWAEQGRARAAQGHAVPGDSTPSTAGLPGPSSSADWSLSPAVGAIPTLDEWTSKRRLAEYGLHGPRERVAESLEAALAAAATLGYPVALKVVSAGLPHKAAVGGVALDVRDEADLAVRWTTMGRTLRPLLQPGEPFRALVSEMVRGGLEILLGIHTDPQFGPLVACGPGGSFAEAFGDVALALPPLTEAQAWDLLERGRLARLLRPGRHGPTLDGLAVVRAIQALGRFALDHRGDIESVDVNPLVVLADGDGVRVLDALIVVAPSADHIVAKKGRDRKRAVATRGRS